MSFRHKLSIAFSLVLLLTIIVSMTSWWGMRKALESQKQVHGFQNHVERTFYAMSTQEKAFTAEETISQSRLVFDHITEMRQQVSLMREQEDNGRQQEQLATLLTRLQEYETAFTGYVQQNLEMQTIRSRMQLEADRLHTRVDELVGQWSLGSAIDHLVITALLLQKEYSLSFRPATRSQLAATVAEIRQLITASQNRPQPDNIRLLTFRLNKTITAFAAIFEQFATEQTAVETAHTSLRTAFSRLSEEFSRSIATKTELVDRHISALQGVTISMAIVAVLLSIAATLLLSEFITRPIDLLKQSAMRIVSGDLTTTVDIESDDEIGELGTLFNTMTERLRTNFKELETYRDRLEELVRERTHELELEISERRETEKALAASEQRFKTIFDNSTDGILIAEPATGRFVLANRTICTMLGYSEQEFLALSAADIHPPRDWEWIGREFMKCAQGLSNITKDVPTVRKNGSIFPAEITATTLLIGDQHYLLGNFRDISERKAVEEERLKVRKLESVGVLAGGIAHDFNNILAAILGNVSLTLALTDHDDRRHQLLRELEKASLRARDLTRQLLTFSKGGEPVKELTSVTDIISESASFILRGSNVRCDFDFADDLWSAEVDPGQISQVIQNIVVNARHAMPDGGVITIRCRNVIASPLVSESAGDRKWLEISITDSGPGIPEELLERIFDPYFTTTKGGSGLGLAITHSIISKHHGTISVHSPPGHGATFTILLPAVDVVPDSQPGGEHAAVLPASGTS